jgi:hypothetical protein
MWYFLWQDKKIMGSFNTGCCLMKVTAWACLTQYRCFLSRCIDNEGVIRNCKSKKDRQCNFQQKKDKRTNNGTKHRKLKIEQHEPHLKPGKNTCALEKWTASAPHVATIVIHLTLANLLGPLVFILPRSFKLFIFPVFWPWVSFRWRIVLTALDI